MALFLPNQVKALLPTAGEINASLLISKYAEVKTGGEKEDSSRIAQRSCSGKVYSGKRTGYTLLPNAKTAAMRLMDRLIIDQSGGVQENANLCLHPHFGVPMISGSAAKGAARHFLWEQWRDAVESGEDAAAAEKAVELVEIFGYPTGEAELDRSLEGYQPSAGKVSFLPALPYGAAPLEVDVLTCHHMDYYSPKKKKSRATDDESPNPQFFPVVKRGAVFEFVVMPTGRGTAELAEKAMDYLKQALENNGIGAKTAAGYGWFEEDTASSETLETDRAKAAEAKELSTLSPMELARRMLLSVEGTNFGEVAVRILEEGSVEEQQALVQVLATDKSDEWKSWKKRAKKKPKLQARVDKALQLSGEFGGGLI